MRVLNVSSESKETDNVVYKSEDSDSSFTIPMETLKTQFSQGDGVIGFENLYIVNFNVFCDRLDK